MNPSPVPPVIGVWYQPVSSFAKWKSRGVNTLIGFENEGGNVSLDQYCDKATAAGLQVILQWNQAAAVRLMTDANVIAVINTPDEPDGAGNVPPAQMIARYKAIKVITTKPVFINLDGWKMQWRPAGDYQAYVQAADWISVDYYPLNRGDGPAGIATIAARISQLQSLVDPNRIGVRFFAFIETSDQNLKVQGWGDARVMRGPTAAEVADEIDSIVAVGANPCYFPDIIGHNFEDFDGTPDAVAKVMTVKNLSLVNISPATVPTPAVPPAPIPVPATPQIATPTPAAIDLLGTLLVVNGRAYYLRAE